MTEVYKSVEDMMERLKKLELKEDRAKESIRKSYNKKIKNDPEFYAAEKKRVVAYITNRCKTDEEYRNKRNEKRREYNQKKRDEKKKQESSESSTE
jgi:hypothetical protein